MINISNLKLNFNEKVLIKQEIKSNDKNLQ